MAANKAHPSASLYVGDLAVDVTEGMLFEMFNPVGPVVSIRVCRDTITRRSLGYAYVNFHNIVDAERALDTLNNTMIKGRPCRIMWSQRDPSIRKSGVGNIYIKNLDTSIDHKALNDTFSIFGNILSCKVAQDEHGNSKGYGFVHFESAESADNAIREVNDMMINSKKVYVGKFVSKKERQQDKEASWTNVYVKDLDLEVTDEELNAEFSKFGAVTSAAVMRKEDGSSKGFGFINFERHDDAVKAVEAMNGFTMKGKKMWAGRAQKKNERELENRKKFEQIKLERLTKYQGVNLFIKNMEDTLDEERLMKEFSAFGNVKSCKIMNDDKGNSRGFGFVCYAAPEEAQRAVNEMNSRILQGCSKPLYVALHQPKEIRRQQLAARHAARSKTRPTGPGGAAGMFPPGTFYPGTAMPFPAMMRGRPTWAGPAGQYPSPMPANYVMPMPGGGAPRGGAAARGSGRSGPANAGRGAGRGGARGAPYGGAPPQVVELNAQLLATLPPDQQKLMLGERLFPLISKTQPTLAPKITGMLLEWDVEDLLVLVNDEEKLKARVQEAVTVLESSPAENGADGVSADN